MASKLYILHWRVPAPERRHLYAPLYLQWAITRTKRDGTTEWFTAFGVGGPKSMPPGHPDMLRDAARMIRDKEWMESLPGVQP